MDWGFLAEATADCFFVSDGGAGAGVVAEDFPGQLSISMSHFDTDAHSGPQISSSAVHGEVGFAAGGATYGAGADPGAGAGVGAGVGGAQPEAD